MFISLGVNVGEDSLRKGTAHVSTIDGVYGYVLVLDKWTGGSIVITPTATDGTPQTATGSISYNADPNIVATNIYNALRALASPYDTCNVLPISMEPFAVAVSCRDKIGLPIVNIGSATSATLCRVGDMAYGAPAKVSDIRVKGGVATGNFYIYGDTPSSGQALSALDSQSVAGSAGEVDADTPSFETETGFLLCRDGTVNGPTWSYRAKAVEPTVTDKVIYDPADGTGGITAQISGTALAMVSSGVDGQPSGEDLLHVTNTGASLGGGFNKNYGAGFSLAPYKRLNIELTWGGHATVIPFRQGRFRLSTDSNYANHLWQYWDSNGYGLAAVALHAVGLPIGAMSRFGTPNMASVQYTRFTVEANTETQTNGHFGKVKLLTGKVPKVCIVVDDGYETDYTNVFPICTAHGVKFCSAIVSSVIGGGNGVDNLHPTMTVAMLQEMHDSPYWEGLNHTKTHNVFTGTGSTPASGVSAFPESNTLQTLAPLYVTSSYNGASPNATAAALITSEYEDCRDALEGWGITKNDGHKHIVYPAGAVNADVVRVLEGTDCIAGRSTYHWPQGPLPDRVLGPETYCYRATGSDHNRGFFMAGINQAASAGADVVFFMHRTNGEAVLAGFEGQIAELARLRDAGMIEFVHFTEMVAAKSA